MLRTVLFFLLVILLAGCSTRGSQALQLTEADRDSVVELSQGQAFSVALPGNPTTGYTWVLMAGDDSIAAQVGEFEFKSEGKVNTAGSGGVIILNFEAAGQGETVLELGYKRPWEDNPPEETFSVTVKVK